MKNKIIRNEEAKFSVDYNGSSEPFYGRDYENLKIIYHITCDDDGHRWFTKDFYECRAGAIVCEELEYLARSLGHLRETCFYRCCDFVSGDNPADFYIMSPFEAALNASLQEGYGYFLRESEELSKGFFDIYARNIYQEDFLIDRSVDKVDVVDLIIDYARAEFDLKIFFSKEEVDDFMRKGIGKYMKYVKQFPFEIGNVKFLSEKKKISEGSQVKIFEILRYSYNIWVSN